MRVVFVSHQNPYPPQSGYHQRVLSILSGLSELGHEVFLAGSTIYANRSWTDDSIEQLEKHYVTKILIHSGSSMQIACAKVPQKVAGFFRYSVPIKSWIYRLPGLRLWFNDLLEEVDPKVIWMNYAFWDGIIDHQSSADLYKVIDIQDLVSLNKKMSLAAYYDLQRHLSNRRGDDNGVLCEDYYQRLGLSVSTEEYAIYDQYDITLAINPAEAVLLRLNTQKTRVVDLPMNYQVPALENKYSGPAIFPMGPNTFNIQGYYYFIRKVLPLVREVSPDFYLQVTGPGSVGLPPEDGVQYSGVLPDLLDSYRKARLAVCPVFGGTGQKIKIIEALAYGVPVVALRASALGSPLVHGVNGFIVDNSKTFAEYIIALWENPGLCRILGANGREKIANGASHKNLLKNLSSLLPEDNQIKAERFDR